MRIISALTRKKRLLVSGFLIFAVLFVLVAAVFIAVLGLREDVFPADIAVVLGNEVYADGTCSPRLAGRLERAVSLYELGLCDKVVVSGGVGSSGFDEAVAMRNYLVSRDVASEDIVVDSSGVNTRATARFTARHMRERGLGSAIAVSQFFHLPRAVRAFEAEGVSRVGSAFARYFEWGDLLSALREVPAYLAYAMRVK